MNTKTVLGTGFLFALIPGVCSVQAGGDTPTSVIRHSYLVLGGKTAIIGEDGKAQWEYRGGSRDGFVLPNGNVLITFSDRVEEIVPAGEKLNQVIFTYVRSRENGELITAQRLYNGNTLIPELGARPRLLEVNAQGALCWRCRCSLRRRTSTCRHAWRGS